MISAIGTISGTSADGIDLAYIETDGLSLVRFGPVATEPYAYDTRAGVLAAIERGPGDRSNWSDLSDRITQDHLTAIRSFIQSHQLKADLVVFHGQTVWHDPVVGETVQLGAPQRLADELNCLVAADLRQADMAAGGEGAPLVPVYHQALARDLEQPLCFLNIGGVSNLTYIDGNELLAFDIGPGNALLDDWIRTHQAGDYDPSGEISARGRVNEAWVNHALQHSFFHRPGPKSLDRNAFSGIQLPAGTSLEDGAATLAALTVEAVAGAEALCPKVPRQWLVCGGGRLNKTLMKALNLRLQGEVVPVEDYRFDGDALEAQAMAYLGARLTAGLPTSFPQTTGACAPIVGGRLYMPA